MLRYQLLDLETRSFTDFASGDLTRAAASISLMETDQENASIDSQVEQDGEGASAIEAMCNAVAKAVNFDFVVDFCRVPGKITFQGRRGSMGRQEVMVNILAGPKDKRLQYCERGSDPDVTTAACLGLLAAINTAIKAQAEQSVAV